MRKTFCVFLALLPIFLASSCKKQSSVESKNVVIVYVALDQDLAEPIFELFEKETGIKVKPKFDTETTKTVALVSEILANKDNQKADVFWNNEIIQTIKLKNYGVTQPCKPANAKTIPARYKDKDGHWFGFAARARVILINKKRFAEKFEGVSYPTSFFDILDEKWGKEALIANPLLGTNATHAAALFAEIDNEKVKEVYRKINQHNRVCASNGETMRQVREGKATWCWTDTDDAQKALAKNPNLKMIYADFAERGSGCLIMPNTICLLKGAPHKEAAEKFINFVLSAKVEAALAKGAGKQIPLQAGVKVAGVEGLEQIAKQNKIFDANFEKIAKAYDASAEYLRTLFE